MILFYVCILCSPISNRWASFSQKFHKGSAAHPHKSQCLIFTFLGHYFLTFFSILIYSLFLYLFIQSPLTNPIRFTTYFTTPLYCFAVHFVLNFSSLINWLPRYVCVHFAQVQNFFKIYMYNKQTHTLGEQLLNNYLYTHPFFFVAKSHILFFLQAKSLFRPAAGRLRVDFFSLCKEWL